MSKGWVQLVRSYRVLGKGQKAAIADARAALASDPTGLKQLEKDLQTLEAETVQLGPPQMRSVRRQQAQCFARTKFERNCRGRKDDDR